MTDKTALSEALLDGWIHMSMTIWNERLVSAMTYNESLVCNLLYKQMGTGRLPLTATELCRQLNIKKPQMNVILNRLEENGIITRDRSETDRRNVYIRLTSKGVPLYEKAHEEILRWPEALIAQLGEEKAAGFAVTMREVTDCFQKLLECGLDCRVNHRPICEDAVKETDCRTGLEVDNII